MKQFIRNYMLDMQKVLWLVIPLTLCVIIAGSIMIGLKNNPTITLLVVFLLSPFMVRIIERS